MGYRVMKIS